jgi:hypothetical protein
LNHEERKGYEENEGKGGRKMQNDELRMAERDCSIPGGVKNLCSEQ